MQADFPIILDACVLAHPGICDLFLRFAEAPRMYLPRWSGPILDEVKRTQMTKLTRPFPEELANYWRQEVSAAFPEAVIEGFEHLLPLLTISEKDRHGLAAAIQGNVSVILTFNLRDFPEPALSLWNVQAVHPQDYLLTLYSMNPAVVLAKLAEIANFHGDEMQDVLIRLGRSVPPFRAAYCKIPGRNLRKNLSGLLQGLARPPDVRDRFDGSGRIVLIKTTDGWTKTDR